MSDSRTNPSPKPSSATPLEPEPISVDGDQVAEFLDRHPDYFIQRPELLMHLAIPHRNSEGASSLLEYQAEVLRDKNRELNRRLKELVAIAGENQQLMERVHGLVLTLMACTSQEQLINELRSRLHSDFNAHTLSVCLFDGQLLDGPVEGLQVVSRDDPALAAFADFFADFTPLCGRLKAEKLAFLFPQQADEISSSVLLPLDREGRIGMLAIGSTDDNRFYPGMGTEFLRLIGEVLGRHLDRSPAAGERLRA